MLIATGFSRSREAFKRGISFSEDCGKVVQIDRRVCDGPVDRSQVQQRWISLRVAADTLPLLVNACSALCLQRLPRPPERYVSYAHTGGLSVQQPLAE